MVEFRPGGEKLKTSDWIIMISQVVGEIATAVAKVERIIEDWDWTSEVEQR